MLCCLDDIQFMDPTHLTKFIERTIYVHLIFIQLKNHSRIHSKFKKRTIFYLIFDPLLHLGNMHTVFIIRAAKLEKAKLRAGSVLVEMAQRGD